MPSLYELHCKRWRDGCGADECQEASRVVFARGSVPCDVLFIGEAPGISEDTLGYPFAGPAGKLMDSIIERAIPDPIYKCDDCHISAQLSTLKSGCPGCGQIMELESGVHVTWAFYNLVGCFPREAKEQGTNEPSVGAILSCAPRLQEFVTIAKPRLIVCVGTLARDWIDQKRRGCVLPDIEESGVKIVDVVHPAAILRANVAQRGLMAQRATVIIQNAVEDL